MEPANLFGHSVLETLLKTNRPPTSQERATIEDFLARTNDKLKNVQAQIANAMTSSDLQAPGSQSDETECELQRLRQEEGALLESYADHLRVLSVIRNLPEDVIRAIFIVTVDSGNVPPELSFRTTPLPYKLAQISSGMRRIALETPALWAAMDICMNRTFDRDQRSEWGFTNLATRASEWFGRAGGLALTVMITDMTYSYGGLRNSQSDPSSVLFDALLSYSPRWKTIRIRSICRDISSPPITRIAALTASDLPTLQTVSLSFQNGISMFFRSPILSVPTLRHLSLVTDWNDGPDDATISDFSVNWAILTSITIRAGSHDCICSFNEVAYILKQTKYLAYCNISLRHNPRKYNQGEINLPHLETLCVETSSSAPLGILEFINAPILAVLYIAIPDVDLGTNPILADFLERSPGIQEFYLDSRLDTKSSLAELTKLLHYCPALSLLQLAWKWGSVAKIPEADEFLRAFVEDGGVGVTCPRLQELHVHGAIKFSFETLCRFLEAKQPGIDRSSVLSPWKRVAIDMRWVGDSEIGRMMELVSRKQAAGIVINVRMKKKLC